MDNLRRLWTYKWEPWLHYYLSDIGEKIFYALCFLAIAIMAIGLILRIAG